MTNYPFQIIDVFGTAPFTGNPLAVIAGADDLSSGELQKIACWLNYSETAFLLPPTRAAADYRVRIFTLARELPFAGHPTLGSCHAWLTQGGIARQRHAVVQECGIGLVTVACADGDLAFAAPPLLRGGNPTVQEIDEVVKVLRLDRDAVLDAQWVDNGPGWIAIMLASADEVLAVEPIGHHGRQVDIGIVGPHPPGSPTAYEVRAIISDAHGNLREDPVTGSLNASVAQWLFASGRIKDQYVASQGTLLGRTGRVDCRRGADGQVWVGGSAKVLFSGTMTSRSIA